MLNSISILRFIIKTNFMLNLVEHEFFSANKYENASNN